MTRKLLFATFIWVMPVITGCGTDSVDVTDSVDQASSVHLKGGANAEPSFFDGGLFLRATADIAGLGEGDVVVTLTAKANPKATCANQGTNEAPGQNPAEVDVTGSISIPAGQIKNGNLTFTVQTVPPPTLVAGAPDCPNSNWTETITDLAFTSATITVEQPEGTIVLIVTCTFSEPTTDGTVPSSKVTCTST